MCEQYCPDQYNHLHSLEICKEIAVACDSVRLESIAIPRENCPISFPESPETQTFCVPNFIQNGPVVLERIQSKETNFSPL